jgi:hypothetical protein
MDLGGCTSKINLIILGTSIMERQRARECLYSQTDHTTLDYSITIKQRVQLDSFSQILFAIVVVSQTICFKARVVRGA